MEADTGLTRKVIENNRHTTFFRYGRVLYVHGGELDAPLGVVRMEYSDSIPRPELVIPQANWKGSYDTGYWKGPCVPIAASTLLLPPADSSEPQRGAVDYEHCIDVDCCVRYRANGIGDQK